MLLTKSLVVIIVVVPRHDENTHTHAIRLGGCACYLVNDLRAPPTGHSGHSAERSRKHMYSSVHFDFNPSPNKYPRSASQCIHQSILSSMQVIQSSMHVIQYTHTSIRVHPSRFRVCAQIDQSAGLCVNHAVSVSGVVCFSLHSASWPNWLWIGGRSLWC